MPAATGITEDQKSRSIDMNNGGGTSTRVYTMRNYTEADDAYKALREYAPSQIWIAGFQMDRTGVRVTPHSSDPEQTIYRGEVSYASPTMANTTPNSSRGGGGGGSKDQPSNKPVGAKQDPEKDPVTEEDPSKVWFTFGTRSKRILQVPKGATQARIKNDADGIWVAENNYRFINKDADDVAPEGVDVQDGTMFCHVTVVLKPSKLTVDFYQGVLDAMMAVNSSKFGYGWVPGQVQFQGIDIEDMVSGDSKVTYHLEVRNMVSSFDFQVSLKGETQTLDAKAGQNFDGFDYTWLSYQDVEINTEQGKNKTRKTYSRKVDSINLASVYPRIRFQDNVALQYCIAARNGKARWR